MSRIISSKHFCEHNHPDKENGKTGKGAFSRFLVFIPSWVQSKKTLATEVDDPSVYSSGQGSRLTAWVIPQSSPSFVNIQKVCASTSS